MTSGVTGFTVGGMVMRYSTVRRRIHPFHCLGRVDNPLEGVPMLGFVQYPHDGETVGGRIYYTKELLSNGGIRSRHESSFVGLFNRKRDLAFGGVLVEFVK